MRCYLELAVVGMRSRKVEEKAALHPGRFVALSGEAQGHDRIPSVARRDVQEWQNSLLEQDLPPLTVNYHPALLFGVHHTGRLGAGRSATSSATPTRRRMWPQATWRGFGPGEKIRSATAGSAQTSACRRRSIPYGATWICGR